MKNVLVLKKRGMDFNYRDSEEAKVSDLQNFRLFGWIGPRETIEVSTHLRGKEVNSYVDCSFADENWIWFSKVPENPYCKPTKEAVLEFVNKKFNKKFDLIVIED